MNSLGESLVDPKSGITQVLQETGKTSPLLWTYLIVRSSKNLLFKHREVMVVGETPLTPPPATPGHDRSQQLISNPPPQALGDTEAQRQVENPQL